MFAKTAAFSRTRPSRTGCIRLANWDADTGTAGIQNGDGVWSSTHANWTADAGATHSVWNSSAGDTAQITTPNTVGTITLAENISAQMLHMQNHYANGYVFDGQGLYTLTLGTGGYVTSRQQTFNVDIDLAGNQNWGLYGGPTIITGDIGETTPSYLYASATAGLQLYGNNSFSGGFRMPQTRVGVGTDSALGTGTLWMSANTTVKQIEALVGPRTLSNPIETAYAGAATPVPFTLAGSNDLTFTGDLNLVGSAGATMDFIVTNTAITEFSGKVISGGGNKNVTKSGAGTLVLSGNNDYTGTTDVDTGTLYVEGTTTGQGDYTVASGATLGGQGIIGLASAVILENGGTLGPGSVSDNTGTLTVTSGDVLFESGSFLDIEIAGEAAGEYDQLVTDGTLTINGGTLTLSFVAGYTPPTTGPTTFQILDWGTFGGGAFTLLDLPALPDASMKWDTTTLYSLGTITSDIPEPATVALLAAAALSGLRRRR